MLQIQALGRKIFPEKLMSACGEKQGICSHCAVYACGILRGIFATGTEVEESGRKHVGFQGLQLAEGQTIELIT